MCPKAAESPRNPRTLSRARGLGGLVHWKLFEKSLREVTAESCCENLLRDCCAMPFSENFSAFAWMEIQKYSYRFFLRGGFIAQP